MENRIREVRKQRKMTMKELGASVGVAESTISQYETGKRNPDHETILRLAESLGTTYSYLIGLEEPTNQIPAGFIPLPATEKKPILGRIACGEPILAEENIEGYADVPEGRGVDFCLICTGDSMIDVGIHDGDTVYIHQQPDVENGQIAAVRIGSTATLKRVYKQPGQLILLAENKSYMPMTYNEGSGEDIQIIGKAVGYQHWF